MLAQPLDFHRPRCAAQGRIDHGKLDRPGTDDRDRLDPARCRNPFVALGFGGMEPKQALAWDGRENRHVSQKRPSMSQKVPNCAGPATTTWRSPARMAPSRRTAPCLVRVHSRLLPCSPPACSLPVPTPPRRGPASLVKLKVRTAW